MKGKILNKISLISVVVAIALVLALVGVLTTSSPMAQADVGTMYMAEYKGGNGTLSDAPDGHYSKEVVALKYGVSVKDVFEIDSGLKLYDYLKGNNNTNNYKVGMLTQDVALSYNIDNPNYDKVGVNSSDAIFDKTLDGNGWTAKIHGGGGIANSTKEVLDDDTRDGATAYRKARRNGLGRYGNNDVWYEYTGYLVAQNYGTIANLTIDFTSGHTVIEAIWGTTGTGNGDLGQVNESITTRLMSAREGSLSAGIITGLNGYGGNIDNVRLNILNSFTAIKRASNNSGYFYENTAYIGGIAGRIEENSVISNCWVDVASSAGVFAGTQGKATVWGGLDDHFAMAVAGGIVGNIDKGTAKLTYCALTGSGQVKAFANRAAVNNRFMAYAGGVVGGCILQNKSDSIHDVNDGYSVEEGQIQGIISSWTGSRFTNFHNDPKTSMGTLFDALGSDEEIKSIAILFNLQTLMDNYPNTHQPVDKDGKLVLDSSGNVRSWLEIHPTTTGGSMSVKFDTANPSYDIRIHIVADGHDEFKDSGVMDAEVLKDRRFTYKMSTGDGGGFIWSGDFATETDSSNHIDLMLDDPIYAEIYLISSKNSGKYNYQFGSIVDLLYSDTNGVNGNLVKKYAGASAPLNLPDVVLGNNSNNIALDTQVFKDENLWSISRDSVSGLKVAQMYMPGIYRMKLETKLGDRVYGYYNEEMRLLAWQPKTDYVFTILQGELSFGEGTTATDGWQESVTFELKMDSAEDFDTIAFQRNGVFPSDSPTARKEGASAFYTVEDGTGKNGTAYTFYAYKTDYVSNEKVVVAVSSSVIVRIDKEAPEVSEIEYYMVENGKERLLSDDEVDELQSDKWTTNQILVKFYVSDNGKSGIATAATESYIHDTELDSNTGDRYVVVEINDSKKKELLYVDGKGNETKLPLQFNVDTVQGRLSFIGDNYNGISSTESIVIFYRAYFGTSGWTLYYSYQKKENGEDDWQYATSLSSGSGEVKQFTINWNMGTIGVGGDDFKIKMVNDVEGLYDDVYPTDSLGKPLTDSVVGNYIIWLRVANIYLDDSLNNIYTLVDGQKKSVAQIIEDGETSKYFDKEYDGTDKYTGNQFYTDLSKLGDVGFYFNDYLGVMYMPTYMSRPLIQLGEQPVELKYSSSNVGDNVKLRFQVKLTGMDGYNYCVYFTDLSAIDFYTEVEVAEGAYSEIKEMDVKISKRTVTIELKDQKEFSESKVYYYGDEIPKYIDVDVKETGERVRIEIKTDASSTASVGIYKVKGDSPNYDNVFYEVNETNITIDRRMVSVDLRYDDGEIGNVPYGVNAATTHDITGTFQDVNGVDRPVNIAYYLNGKLTSVLGAVGLYTIEITLPDNNYMIPEGQRSFKFNIAKGYLDVGTGVRIKQYTQDAIEYDPIIDEASKDLYDYENDISVTYYRYMDGAYLNSSTNKIEGNYDNKAPLAGAPTERGYYFVEVKFVRTTDNFFAQVYEGYLIISKSDTKVNVEKVTLEYSYNAEMKTFSLSDAVTEVRSSSNRQLWTSANSSEGIVKVQYKNAKGSFVDVASNPNAGGGWYSEVGRYEYRVTYSGNADYEESQIDVVMVINEAELKGITFTSVNVVYDGKSHVPTPNGLLNYTGLKVTYQHGTTKVDDVNKLNLVNASDNPYTVYMKVQKSGYQILELTATVTINKAKMEGVTVNNVDADYDGQKHYITFNGLTSDTSGNLYYKETLITFVSNSNSEGNTYATNVKIEEGVGPSYYMGKVILRATNYEDLELITTINIKQVPLQYQEIGKDLPNKLPSAMSLKDYKGYYVDNNGNKVECALQFVELDSYGEIRRVFKLDENDTLADGRYSVMLAVEDTNYYIDRYWTFEIGEINSAKISTLGFVAIGVVVALMAGAIVTAVVVVKKRKKAGVE